MKTRGAKGIILAAAVAVLLFGVASAASAGVDVRISIPLFGLHLSGPPVVYAPPAPHVGVSIGPVFFGGLWYRPRGGHWYVSAQVGGPWYSVEASQVPPQVIGGPVPSVPPPGYYVAPSAPVVIEQPVYQPYGIIILDQGRGRGHGRGGYDD